MKSFLLSILSLAFLPLSALAAAPWLDSLPEAREQAAAQQKDLLVLYRGSNYRDPEKSPALLLASPYFLEAAQAKYVLVEQDAPLIPDDDGKEAQLSTRLLVCDAQGRPYHCIDNEMETGMDWLMVEFQLADERRAVVLPLWQAHEASPDDEDRAAALLAALPTALSVCDPRCRKLRAEAEARGDMSVREREDAHRSMGKLMVRLVTEMNLRAMMGEGDDSASRTLRSMPVMHQYCRHTAECMLLIQEFDEKASKLSFAEAEARTQQMLRRVIAIEPRSKCARYCRELGSNWLMLYRLTSIARDDSGSDDLLSDLNAMEPECRSFFARQLFYLLRSRLLMFLCNTDAALDDLQRAYDFDPLSDNGKEAARILQCIRENRALIDEIQHQRRLGVDEANDYMVNLMKSSYKCQFVFTSFDSDTFYADDATVAEARHAADEQAGTRPDANALPGGSVTTEQALRQRAEQGDEKSQLALAMLYLSGMGVEKDVQEALVWFRRAAENGEPQSQALLAADAYRQGNSVEQDKALALEWARKSAEQGYATGQVILGLILSDAATTDAERAEAVTWFRRAAEQGNVDGEFYLGSSYYYGVIVGEDIDQAITWLTRAAKQGNVQAQFFLGQLYTSEDGYQDDLQAEYWTRKAADQGHAEAQYNMASIVSASPAAKAEDILFWLRQAADQDLPEALFHLARYVEAGAGCETDPEMAEKMLRRAAEQGYQPAIEKLKALEQPKED